MGAVWDYFTGKIQSESDRLDAALAAENQRARDKGVNSDDTFKRQEDARLSRNTTGLDVNAEVAASFTEGWKDGFDAETGAIKNGLNTVAGGTLRFIWDALPWWAWLAALFGILFYAGLLTPLVNAAKKSIKA